MRDTLRLSADRMRLQAIVVTISAGLAASTLPGVSYYYIFQHDDSGLGPFAWAHWAVVFAACVLGLLAHALACKALLATHVALCGMLGAALGGFDTAFWYQLATRCATTQISFQGCQLCPCAAIDVCSAADLAGNPLCQSCAAYPREACDPVLQQANKFILAFTGLAAVVFLALPAAFSLLVLCRLEASGAAAASKRQMVSFAVDQQTTLVESNDKPTVTPAMLAAWVTFLLDCGEPDCAAIGAKCRSALAGRGFELPVIRDKKAAATRRRWLCFGRRSGTGSSKGGAQKLQIAVDAASSSLPAAEAYAAAEAGDSYRSHKAARASQLGTAA